MAEDGLPRETAFNISDAQIRQAKAARVAEELLASAMDDMPDGPWSVREELARLATLDRLLALHDYERRAAAALRKQVRKT